MATYYEVGRYEAEITSQGFTETSTGKTQFVLKFKVLGKIDPNDQSSLITVESRYEQSYYRVLTDNTVEYFMKDLESLGVQISSFSELDPNNPNHISLVGRTFDAYCNHENNQKGELRDKWSVAMKSSESRPVESADSSKVKALDRMFGRHLKKAGAPAATAAPRRAPVPAGGGQEISDDDIPF